ncbi:MAG: HYR domain-containing protein, partial [Dermatophilaceae bacterium]
VSVHSGDKTVATRAGTAGKVALLAANGRPVAVDLAQHTVSRFDAKSGQLEGTQPIELRADDAVTVGASPGADEVFAAVTNRGVLIICDLDSGANRVVQLPPGLSRLGRPVEAHGRVFLPDLGTGLVHIVDTTSRRFVTSVTVPGGPAGHLQLIPREDRVFYNDPDSERAGAILMDGTLTAASKYNPTNPSEGLTPAPADVTPVNLAPIAQPSSRTTETPPPPDSSAATSAEATAPSVPRQGSAGNDPSAGGRGSGGQGGASAGGIGAGGQGGQSGQGAISPSPAATPTETPRVTPTDTTRPPSLEGTITLTSRAPVVGQTVNLQMLINGVPAATAVSWSFGDGTSVSKNPVEHTWHANSGAGVYLVTATTQVNGSTIRATAEVSVKDSPDTTAPVITVPADQERTAPYGSADLKVTYPDPTAKDDRDPAPHLECSAHSGDMFKVGRTTAVSCKARDASGNESKPGSFTVTVVEAPAPVPVFDPYSPPPPKSVPTGTTTVVTYSLPKARDATGQATVSCSPASGSRFGEGPTTVTCTATNVAGKTNSMPFVVTIIGIDPPDPDPLVCSKKPYLPQCGGP